jgi:hypothetical protein
MIADSLPDLRISDDATARWPNPPKSKKEGPFSAAELKEKELVKV